MSFSSDFPQVYQGAISIACKCACITHSKWHWMLLGYHHQTLLSTATDEGWWPFVIKSLYHCPAVFRSFNLNNLHLSSAPSLSSTSLLICATIIIINKTQTTTKCHNGKLNVLATFLYNDDFSICLSCIWGAYALCKCHNPTTPPFYIFLCRRGEFGVVRRVPNQII